MSDRMIRCTKCIHYYITYDPERPYGCNAMGFKSRISPAQVVYTDSGIICQLYTEKNKSGTDPQSRVDYFNALSLNSCNKK